MSEFQGFLVLCPTSAPKEPHLLIPLCIADGTGDLHKQIRALPPSQSSAAAYHKDIGRPAQPFPNSLSPPTLYFGIKINDGRKSLSSAHPIVAALELTRESVPHRVRNGDESGGGMKEFVNPL